MKQAKGLALATPFLSLAACDEKDARRDLTLIDGRTMGTSYSVKIAGFPDTLDRNALAAGIDRRLELVNQQMSTYRPDSELSRFNASDASAWTGVSEDTLTVIAEALRLSRLSDGAFDPTVGPVVNLWGFGPNGHANRVPSSARIAAARETIGYQHVRVRQGPPAVAKGQADIQVDLSGIAKGFGVDKVAELLEETGMHDYLVEVGGDLRSGGRNAERASWRIGIEKPQAAPGSVQRIVHLGGQALATSGDYRIYFESGGTRYSHIVNPQTGRPVTHALASATVVAHSAMQADALSTALFVLGPEAGLDLAKRHDISAFFIVKTDDGFAELASPTFSRFLEV